MTSVLITGATGFVGHELVRALLAATSGLDIVALVRAPNDGALQNRRRTLIRDLPDHDHPRLHTVRGDTGAPNLGMNDKDYAALVDRVDRVVHCAASTRFDLTLDEARRQNVISTERIVAFCRSRAATRKGVRLDYVSTAFVAGMRRGLVREDELVAEQSFRNTYERSKFEAEKLCRDLQGELPIAIYRPSVVVGKQNSGETTSYKALYGPLKVLVRFYNSAPRILNRIVPLPLPPDTRVDLVPVDFVAEAIVRLFAMDAAVGRCYHLAAGPDGSATVSELAELTCRYFDTPCVRTVAPTAGLRFVGQLLARLARVTIPKAGRVGEMMFAYGLGMPSFDTTQTRAAGLVAPRVAEYFQRVLAFASNTDFGRRPASAGSSAFISRQK